VKLCADCLTTKPSEAFHSNARSRDGLAFYCRDCASKRSRQTYQRRVARQGGEATARLREQLPSGTRRCPDCDQVQDLEAFPLSAGAREGRGTYCKPCHNRRGRESRDRKGGSREYHLRRRYGIGVAEYEALVAEQGGVCAVCRTRTPEHVDHDHLTGAVRGVLCSGCNQGLGNFRDSAAALRQAIDYLERTTWQRHQEAPGVYRLTSPLRRAASPSSSDLQPLTSSRRG
jgi:hypothetical protein